MWVKTVYLPLLAIIFALIFISLISPVTALDVSPVFRNGEVGLNSQFFGQLGEAARRYGENMIEEAAARSTDLREKIGELKEQLNAVVLGVAALHDEIQVANCASDKTDGSSVSVEDIARDVERVLEKVTEDLEVMFPTPEEAPGREQRRKVVSVALDKVGTALVTVCVNHRMNEERARSLWEIIRAAIERLVVLLGDFIEQHPFLSAALFEVLNIGLTRVMPGFWLLRLLLRIFGFGSSGPIKGTAASWAQRVFYGPAVNKGSWFAFFQKAAMT